MVEKDVQELAEAVGTLVEKLLKIVLNRSEKKSDNIEVVS